MKPLTSAKIAGAAALAFLLFLSCTKVGLDEIDNEEIIGGQKIKESKCDLLSFSYPDYYGNGQRYMFNRTYDHAGGKLTFIKVGLYSGGGIVDTAFLNVVYGTDVVYFVNAKNALDTSMVAYLNRAGRVIKIELGNDINGSQLKYSPSPQEFYYKNGQLQQIYINSTFGFFFRYDQFDNLTQIVTDTIS